jgi:uncharacterized protein (DUF433 family)
MLFAGAGLGGGAASDVPDAANPSGRPGATLPSPGTKTLRYTPTVAPDLLERITHNPAVMGGRACIRGLRVTVGAIVGLMASGHSTEQILEMYPYLERDDLFAALTYAAWRAAEVELPLKAS